VAECRLNVRVTPRSSQNKVVFREGLVRVWVTSAPTDGQANEAVLQALSKALGIAPSRLSIVRGDTGRNKVVAVEGMDLHEITRKLG
jgi:uncharacterized protein (TIGR00251 family)